MINRLILLALICFIYYPSQAQQNNAVSSSSTSRERLSLDKGWQFHLGDIPFPVIKGHNESYGNAKAGKAWGAAAPEFDDRSWRTVKLPHDWAVESPFDSTENLSQGYRKRGFGWYRRNFKLDAADKRKHIELQFDGIATFVTIWVNGTVMHRNWCGYTSMYLDITPLAKYGDDINNIAIRVDANAQEGWWYEGAGMYRHTWLVKRAPVHITTDGVFANPIKLANGSWEIPAEINLENSGKTAQNVEVEVTLVDEKGKVITKNNTQATVGTLTEQVAKLKLQVNNPLLWNLEKPTLYKVITTVKQKGIKVDELTTSCGFRTIRFDPNTGFYLNDKSVKIKGLCNHQDHAGVGVAVPESLWAFRLKKMKEMGANAHRCAHNPPSAEFLAACDSLGILVMDENRNFNTSPEYVRQLQWLVRRDRNHPSVILWSVFNEESMQGTESGYEMVRRMSAKVKELDTTRPVTAAQSGGQFNPINVSQAVDLVGFNYQYTQYDRFHKEHPNVPLTSSEDVSGLMTRGEYETDRKRNLIDSYDTQKPGWGTTHRVGWKAIAERPFVAGAFVWTGFDYRGEPTPYQWPSAGSFFGVMDLCGFPKMAFYLHQAQWVTDRPILQLVPHWNHPAEKIGKDIKVMVLSNAEKVKLILNGKEISEQIVDKYEMNTWMVPFQPGKLEAVGYVAGKEVSRFKVETTGEPVAIELIPDRKSLNGDGLDAMPVTVQVVDAKGRPVPTSNLPITFAIEGAGSIIGVGNGNPNSHEPEKANYRKLYNGLAQVIIQSSDTLTGKITLIAESKGLKSAKIVLDTKAVTAIPSVAISYPALVLDKWLVSPQSTSRPDPKLDRADNDMNTWSAYKPGTMQTMVDGQFMVFYTDFKPYLDQQKAGGKLSLKKVTGKAEVWLDGKQIGLKTTAEVGDLTFDFPASSATRKLIVVIESEKGTKAGLGGVVTVR